jgi:EAL domain-containing protein (putative c-di-GMP-specific phosphodiesterase class I)
MRWIWRWWPKASKRLDQLQLLRDIGCEFFQGWLHSRAMPAEQVRDWLAA